MGAQSFTTAMDVLVPALGIKGIQKDGDRWVICEGNPNIDTALNICVAATVVLALRPGWSGVQVSEWMQAPNGHLKGMTPAAFAASGENWNIQVFREAAEQAELVTGVKF